MQLTDIEKSLVRKLSKLCSSAQSSRISTVQLKEMLYNVGETYECNPYGSQIRHIDETSSEWLYDFCWWKTSEGAFDIIDIPLVVESEAGNEIEVLRDFRKLMQARATHRLLVFQCPIERIVPRCSEMVKKFSSSLSGDRYLFFQWIPGNGRFAFMVYPDEPVLGAIVSTATGIEVNV